MHIYMNGFVDSESTFIWIKTILLAHSLQRPFLTFPIIHKLQGKIQFIYCWYYYYYY